LVARAANAQSAGGSVAVGASATSVTSVSASAQVSAQITVQPPSREDVSAALGRVPLRVGVHGGVGWTRSWDRPLLDGYATEFGGSLGVWATPWLAIEARGTYVGLLRRLSDNDGNSRADSNPGYLEGILAIAQGRFRLSEDSEKVRNGWSFSIGGGALIPWANADGRGVGPVLEAGVARHVGVISSSGSALDLSFELRARTGLGSLIDYQSVVGSIGAAWEGNQRVGAAAAPSSGYRPGHTAGIEGLVGGFFSAPNLAGTNILWSNAGGGVSLHAGLVLSSGFELTGRVGYLGRGPGRKDEDWLNFGFFEGGLRARWYLFYAEANAGLFAPFGTFRDRVAANPFAGGALGLRLPFNRAEDPGFRFLLGLRARVGVMEERAFDGLFFTAGFEFEGGQHHAAFPRFTPAAVSVVTGGAVQAGGAIGAGVAGPTQSSYPRNNGTNYGGVAPRVEPPRIPAEPARVPLAINVGAHAGYIAPIDGARLQRTVGELSLTASWAAAHWLALDARFAWFGAAARTEDLTGDGRADTTFGGFGGPHLSIGPRFRWLDDMREQRYGWTFALAGGALLPTTGPLAARGPGATIDVAIAREFGWILDRYNAFGLAVELRGRTGLGAWGDYHTAMLGLRAWWEGNVSRERTQIQVSGGYRPGHTFAIDGGAALFPLGAVRANGQRWFGDIGGHIGASAGVVFTPGFEWFARGGYLHRPGSDGRDDLAAITAETGARMRIGWISARAMVGYAAVVGTQRDEVQSSLYAGAGIQARLAVSDRVRLLGGVEGRFALSNERALDHVGLTMGFEFEGGSQFAAQFARRAEPAPDPAPGYTGVTTNVVTEREPTTSRAVTTTTVVSTGVAANASGAVSGGVSGGVSVGVTAPLRVSFGAGITAGSHGLGRFDLDGSGGAYTLAVGWVAARWLSLELTGGLLATQGHNSDADGDGQVELRRDGMLQGTLTLGPRFRVLTDDFARYGWSFHVAGGLIASPVALGPLGELAIAHHLAAITGSHMAFELGIEARGRLGWMPNRDVPSNGELFQGLTVGLTAAWEGNVHRNSAPMSDAQLGETLSIEGGYGLAISPTVGPRATLGASVGTVGVRTGLVFTPGFEWSARAGYFSRNGEKSTATHEYLLAESGPRFRWGWAYGELAVGYAGTINAYRDSVAGSLTGSAGAGVRFGLTGRGHHFGVTAGVQARFGISSERAYDSLFLMAGIEFEGGRRQAHPFPEMQASPRPAARPAVIEVPTTSPRYQATGGVTQTHTVTIPTRVEVGVSGSAVFGGATTVHSTVLTAGAVVDSSPFGTGVSLSEEELVAMLPGVDRSVRVLDVALRVPATVSALSVEGALRAAIARRYAGATMQATARVIVGGSASGRFELELRAR
jgi:hypothetical protein